MKIKKYHGLGNEFLLTSVRSLPKDPSRIARLLCDYTKGPGADGLIFSLPAEDESIHAQMVLFNSDGSPAEISGNGLRCLAHHIYIAQEKNKIIQIRTDAGNRKAEIKHVNENQAIIRTDMGIPVLGQDLTNNELSEKVSPEATKAGYVNVGNPHIVILFESLGSTDIAELGASVEKACSETGINVHLIEIINRSSISMLTWERGVGVTKACGSGAVASACKAQSWGLVDEKIKIRMPGGEALIEIESDDVYLTGESEFLENYEVDISA